MQRDGEVTSSVLALPRLDRILDSARPGGVVLVFGPAGSGKSTLVRQFARRGGTTTWITADASLATPEDLWRAIERAEPIDLSHPSTCPSTGPATIVVDDVHEIAGTPAADALRDVVASRRSGSTIVLCGRDSMGLALSRMQIDSDTVHVAGDDLRFRTWEVEDLFRDHYRQPLSPEELAALARRLGGWAAGLRMFHLATAGAAPGLRRTVIDRIGTRADVCRDYLRQNVLEALPPEESDLLIHTCVLGRLSPTICDDFLGVDHCERILDQLERRQIFTLARDGDGSLYYHDVLRGMLETELLDRIGEAELRREYRRGAEVLTRHGCPADALRACCRGDDPESAATLLRSDAEQLASHWDTWWDVMPAALVERDPWILLARARRVLGSGDVGEAVALYRKAELLSRPAAPHRSCEAERRAAEEWLRPPLQTGSTWSGRIRDAIQRTPLSHSTPAGQEPADRFSRAMCLLLAGHADDAARALESVARDDRSSDVLVLGARVATAFAWLLGGGRGDPALEVLAHEAELANHVHLARLAAAVQAATGPGRTAAWTDWPTSTTACWVAALTALADGLGTSGCSEDHRQVIGQLDQASQWLAEVGAGTLQAWAEALRACHLAFLADPSAASVALAAERLARRSGVPGARTLANAALASARGCRGSSRPSDEPSGNAAVLDRLLVTGSSTADSQRATRADVVGEEHSTGSLRVDCLGSLTAEVDGESLDLSVLRPRVRSLLGYLAVHADEPVHREVLIDALWHHMVTDAATHNLQVSVSSLRRLLEPGAARGNSRHVMRSGDSYQLGATGGLRIDVVDLRAALKKGRAAAAAGLQEEAESLLSPILDTGGQAVLPEEGPTDWVVAARRSHDEVLVEAASIVGALHVEAGRLQAAEAAFRAGLEVDRHRDELWRALIALLELSESSAAAEQARRSYDEVLAELGVVDPLPDPLSRGSGRPGLRGVVTSS